MKTQRTKQTAYFTVLFTVIFLAASVTTFAGGINVSVSKKSYNGADVSCFRAQDAQLTINATGGSGIYTYSIDNGKNYQQSKVFSGLAGGQNYIVVVKDSRGQTSSAQWIWVSTVYTPVTISSYYATKTTCPTSNDADLSFSAYGGTGKLVFSIDNGATWQSETSFKNLSAGNYTLIARDVNGCTSDDKLIKIESGTGVQAIVDYKEDYSCTWGKGSVKVRGANGQAPYKYSIDGLPYVFDNDFTNLAPGNHMIVVVDSKGCTGSVSFEINAALTATLSGDTTINEGGTVNLYIDITEGSARRTGYTLEIKGSDGQKYTFNNLRSGDNILSLEDISASTTFTISKLTSAAGCTAYTDGAAVIKVETEKRIVWLGKNSDWNDKSNWSNSRVPDEKTEILIGKKPFSPVINDDASVQNITMTDGTLLINGRLIVSGIFIGTPGTIDAKNGTIEFEGNGMQELIGNIFVDKSIGNLIIKNDLSLTDSLNVYGNIQFNEAGKDFYTNDLLTLKSTSEGTASVGDLSKNSILGKVTVENYIAPKKGWKFLAIPTISGQSIHDAWQEGQSDNKNLLPGKGIQIPGEMSDWKAKGFDAASYSPAVKYYNSNTDQWVGIKSTYESFDDNINAYMVFIRGDRGATSVSSPVTETTLRTQGELKSGDQKTLDILPGKFIPVGNPYAAALDLKEINTSRNMFFYFWDPELGNNYGAYQTVKVNKNGTFKVVPGSEKMKKSKVNIESGQAFFVYSKKGGTLQITESSKADIKKGGKDDDGDDDDDDDDDDDRFGYKPAGIVSQYSGDDELEVKLYSLNNGASVLVDGILQSFNREYSNAIDELDALKSINTGENLSIKSGSNMLAMESSSFTENTDTTQLNLTGVKYQSYQFEISLGRQSNDKEAILVDRFTGKSTPLTGSTVTYDFEITRSAASYAANRFIIIFRPMKPMPVTFNGIKAEKKQDQVEVSWKIANEINVKEYNVERSLDAVSFSAIGKADANKATDYNFNDVAPSIGVNYYRVVSIDIDGKKGYSEIVKVVMNATSKTGINVYPNPVIGNTVNLQMNIQNKGVYYINIKNQIGQVIDSRKVNVIGSQVLEINPASKLSSGVYTVEVTHPTGEQSVVRFVK